MALFYASPNTLTLATCNGGSAPTISYRIRDDYLLDGSFVDVVVAINVNNASYLLVDGEHIAVTVGADWAGTDGYKFLTGGTGQCAQSGTPVAFTSGEVDLDAGWQVYYSTSHSPQTPQNLGRRLRSRLWCYNTH
jgi:hypothetical protein